MPTKKAPTERLSVPVSRELKRALRTQAQRTGLSLSDWVRTRLELEGADPDALRALAAAAKDLDATAKRTCERLDAIHAERLAGERLRPAREAAIRAHAMREAAHRR